MKSCIGFYFGNAEYSISSRSKITNTYPAAHMDYGYVHYTFIQEKVGHVQEVMVRKKRRKYSNGDGWI